MLTEMAPPVTHTFRIHLEEVCPQQPHFQPCLPYPLGTLLNVGFPLRGKCNTQRKYSQDATDDHA